MSLIKYANAPLTDISTYVAGISESAKLVKKSGVVYKMDPNYSYSVVIGIQGDTWNENNDLWPMNETLLAPHKTAGVKHQYQTWKGKPNCKNHINNGENDHYGFVVDTWHMHGKGKTASEGSKDVLMVLATDRRKNPKLVSDIEKGAMNTVSMGCMVGFTKCSLCGKKAITEKDYCPHIKFQRGRVVPVPEGADYYKKASTPGLYSPMIRIGEVCYDITGMEMSWVDNPAFPNCTKLDTLASKHHKQAKVIDPRKHKERFEAFSSRLQQSPDPVYREAGRAISKMASKEDLTQNELLAFTQLIQSFKS